MKEEDKTYQLIEEYLNKNLREAELDAFEKELQGNSGLHQKVKLQKLANELVIENRLLQVKEILHQQKLTGGSSKWKYGIGILTGLLLLTGIIVLKNNTPKEEKSPNVIAKVADTKLEGNTETESTEIQQSSENKSLAPKKESLILAADNAITAIDESKTTSLDSGSTPGTPLTTNSLPREEPTEEKKQEVKVSVIPSQIDPCSIRPITANISSQAACAGEEDGSIFITKIQGGSSPYKITVGDENHEYQSSLGLSSGTYSVKIKDTKGCSTIYENIIVATKTCSKDYSFNPFIGESWNIPSGKHDGKLFVYNDSGNVYYEKEITAGAEEQWAGESKTGEIKTGYFIFVLKYKDGTQTQGSVTIVR